MQPSIPGGAEQDAAARIERSFLVLRIVRGAVLLLFWAVALVAVTVGHWPTGAAIVVHITLVILAIWLTWAYGTSVI